MKNICEKLFKTFCLLGCTFVFLIFHPHMLGSETLQITTYYPAPYGGYVKMLTTDQTVLARDGGRVGIGTPSPGYLLDVDGDMFVAGRLRLFCKKVNYSLRPENVRTSCPANHYPVAQFGQLAANNRLICVEEKDKTGKLVHKVCDATGVMICCKIEATY